MRLRIPALLILVRFALGPILYWQIARGGSGAVFACGLAVALLTDVFDGVVARRLGVATPKLREVDSWVDGWFCLWVAASAWFAHRSVVVAFSLPIGMWVASDWLALALDWRKFRRFSSYHAYSSKLAGCLLGIAVFWLFLTGQSGWLLGLALCVAIISHLERMAITAVMKEWVSDIPTFWHARRRR